MTQSLPNRMRLKVAMTKHHLSVEDVAAITGRTIRTVYSWTGGERPIPEHILIVIEQHQPATGGTTHANE